ncbi:hypothetical protein SEA_ATUIN_244 [Arthrobacter phage Atuin]|nr:hypothetical protein SEA_ATUIN_43 [Arthrobacter phage Atuin]
MTLTPKQIELLDALVEETGAPEPKVNQISRHYNYDSYIKSGLEGLIYWYSHKKLADSTDWDEIERQQREERERKLAERSEEVRLRTMTSIMSGLLPKISKIVPDSRVIFDITEEEISLMVFTGGDDCPISVQYSKGSLDLSATVAGDHYLEDTTYLNGNTSPRQQLKGIDAVHVYLDSLELDK